MHAVRTSRESRSAAIQRSPSEIAGAAGLRYSNPDGRGIRRLRAGHGFRYVRTDGTVVRDPVLLERIRKLAVPPAYREVWISTDPRAHVQAVGRDARGRKQYRYHPRWREVRDETKYERMLAFARALPAIRRGVARDLGRRGLPKEKVVAAMVRLLEQTGIRVGNDEYARDNGSYGLTTLKDAQAHVSERCIFFSFRGKGGKLHRCELCDRRLARVVARCRGLPGEKLFQYVDEHGKRRSIDSVDVNAYLRRLCGEDFSAKDFRTWSGTLLAAAALLATKRARTAGQRKRQALAAIDRVAEQLNNTRSVCRKYYVHPDVLEAFEQGSLEQAFRFSAVPRASSASALSRAERSLIALLERRTRPARSRATRPRAVSGGGSRALRGM